MTYEKFTKFMVEDCGMSVTEDGAVICCECGEPIYFEDSAVDYDWSECPVCGFDIKEE